MSVTILVLVGISSGVAQLLLPVAGVFFSLEKPILSSASVKDCKLESSIKNVMVIRIQTALVSSKVNWKEIHLIIN